MSKNGDSGTKFIFVCGVIIVWLGIPIAVATGIASDRNSLMTVWAIIAVILNILSFFAFSSTTRGYLLSVAFIILNVVIGYGAVIVG